MTNDKKQYIYEQAEQPGISIEAIALQLLTQSIVSRHKQAQAIDVLQTWIDDEDVAEQQETGQYLLQVLDRDQLSERQLFPLETKGD